MLQHSVCRRCRNEEGGEGRERKRERERGRERERAREDYVTKNWLPSSGQVGAPAVSLRALGGHFAIHICRGNTFTFKTSTTSYILTLFMFRKLLSNSSVSEENGAPPTQSHLPLLLTYREECFSAPSVPCLLWFAAFFPTLKGKKVRRTGREKVLYNMTAARFYSCIKNIGRWFFNNDPFHPGKRKN